MWQIDVDTNQAKSMHKIRPKIISRILAVAVCIISAILISLVDIKTTINSLSIELMSGQERSFRLYYDTGLGYNEQEAVAGEVLRRDKQSTTYHFPIPHDKSLISIRIDPDEQPARYLIKSVSWNYLDHFKRVYPHLTWNAGQIEKLFVPLHNVKPFVLQQGRLLVETEGPDPHFGTKESLSETWERLGKEQHPHELPLKIGGYLLLAIVSILFFFYQYVSTWLKKISPLFWGVLALISLVNIWHTPLLPFTDLPNHLFEAYILQDRFPSVYGINVFVYSPACLHAVFCAIFHDIEIGNKVFYSIYLLLLPASILLLIRVSRGEKWFGLLSFCFLYSYSVTWGFSSFTIGIALSLLTVYFYIGMLSSPSFIRFILLSCLLILTFYAHAILFIFVCTVIGCCSLFLLKTPLKHRLLGVLPVFPSVVIFMLWILNSDSWQAQPSTLSFMAEYYSNSYIPSLTPRVVHLLYADNEALADGYIIWSIPLLMLLPFVLQQAFFGGYNYICSFFRPAKGFPAKADTQFDRQSMTTNARAVGLVFFFVAAGYFFLLPDQIPSQPILFERFSVFVFLSLIWTGSFTLTSHNRIMRFRRPVQSLVVMMVILSTIMWSDYFWNFGNYTSAFERVLQDMPELKRKSLAAIIDDNSYRGRPVLIHYQNYHAIWNGGLVPTNATQYRFRLITPKKNAEMPHYTEWINKGTDIGKLIRKYEGMDFLLAHGPNVVANVEEYGEHTLCSMRNGWVLFRKIRDQ